MPRLGRIFFPFNALIYSQMVLQGFFYRSLVHSRKHEFTCQQALGERKEEEEEEEKTTTSPRPGFDPTTRDLSITSRVFYPLGHGATPRG